ncbi:MAG: hypothetical protein OEW18_01935 [Candidatus Aminicenantes bacterium]|nr:hypothetical protein [Candidatus Aminicenantes bacterium]
MKAISRNDPALVQKLVADGEKVNRMFCQPGEKQCYQVNGKLKKLTEDQACELMKESTYFELK